MMACAAESKCPPSAEKPPFTDTTFTDTLSVILQRKFLEFIQSTDTFSEKSINQIKFLTSVYKLGTGCIVTVGSPPKEKTNEPLILTVGSIEFHIYAPKIVSIERLILMISEVQLIINDKPIVLRNFSRECVNYMKTYFPIDAKKALEFVNTVTSFSIRKEGSWINYSGVIAITNKTTGVSFIQEFEWSFPSYLVLGNTPEEQHIKFIDIIRLASLAQFDSPFIVGCVQTDAHPTSTEFNTSVWIGMSLYILSHNGHITLPIFLVGGDIGCGLSAFGVTNRDGKILNIKALPHEARQLSLKLISILQRDIRRGAGVEKGEMGQFEPYTLQELKQMFTDSISFAVGMEANQYYKEVYDMIIELNWTGVPRSDIPDRQQIIAQEFLVRYFGSLGSSGNHFLELCVDVEGNLVMVVHSGGRAFGATANELMQQIFPMVNGNRCCATTLEHAQLAAKIYDIINKFALINRAMCIIIAVRGLASLGENVSIIPEQILDAQRQLPWISLLIESGFNNPEQYNALVKGIVHNGITGLMSKCGNYATIVVKKGSIVSIPGETAIVANDCSSKTAGVTIFTNTNPATSANMSLQIILGLVQQHKVELVPLTHPAFSGAISLPHGAGRDVSAGTTYREVKNTGVSAFIGLMQKLELCLSLSPDTANDMPGKAYRSQNLSAYQQSGLAMFELRTIANFKEGINRQGFATFLKFVEDLINIYKNDILSFAYRIQDASTTMDSLMSYVDVLTTEQLLFKMFCCLDLILINGFAKDNIHYNIAMILKSLCINKLMGIDALPRIYSDKLHNAISELTILLEKL
jgi:hypothetical protein